MSFKKKKNTEKKDIFELNHIDKNLSDEKIKEIMDLYKYYHKKIGLIKVIILEKRKLTY